MKKLIASTLLVLFVLTNITAFADNDKNNILNVQGKVVDKNTGEALAGVVINIAGEEVYTDFEGNFTLSVPSNATIEVSLISYQAVEIEAADLESGEYLEVALEN